MVYKGEDTKNFLTGENNGIELLQEYLQDLSSIPEDISKIQVISLKDPYKNIAWLFTRVVRQDFTGTIPQFALYIFHFKVHENEIFN